jgi:uncharacterized membrane protein (UPF0182 family)
VVVFLFLLPGVVRFFASWLWYQEIGYQVVLLTEITTRIVLFLAVAAVTFAILYLNARFAQRGPSTRSLLLRDAPVEIAEALERLPRIATPVSAVIAVLTGLSASAGWLSILQMLNRTPFGASDPVFGRDIGFYVFVFPVLSTVLPLLITLTVLSAMMVGAIYLLRGDITPPGPQFRVSPDAAGHLGSILVVFFILTAAQLWIVSIPELLFSTTGRFTGASYTDMNAHRVGINISAFVALIGAVFVVLGIVRRRVVRHALIAAGAYLGVSLLARGLYPAAIQRLVVAPTELTRERPFLAHHIAATRRAWGIDSVQTRDISGDVELTIDDIRANGPTIENVRLWDREPLLQTFGQIQEIRTYYDFISVDDDRYWIDGRYRQVLLSPRELNTEALPTRSFINDHLTFTHGMGITLAPVNQVTLEGLPVLFIKDLPPVSSVSLRTTRPQIYYGELTNYHAIAGTRQSEFDHPSGEANIFANYDGTGGVRVGSLLRRSLLAWHFRSLKLLLSQDISRDSRILFHRNIVERARRALPFVRLDGDPYMVLNDAGELKWMIDGYTTSSRYPYAQRLVDGTSYMRNSVKIVIDAYHGSVNAYVADATDPIIQTMGRIFDGILQPLDSMPADLRTHIRYPEDLYRAQAALYTTYHMTEPDLFYHREDQWQIPVMDRGQERNPFMRHIVMRLPDEEKAEFIFMTPFTPRQKDNLAAWMVARNDGENYGKLRVYRFPKQSLVFGPRQIVNRINQDTEIARQITLWDQRGSEVIRGELLVIPIEVSLIYVQPIYLRAQGGQIPELKRVVVAHQNRVVMEETLEMGLARLFGAAGDAPPPAARPEVPEFEPEAPASNAALVRQLLDIYERAISAQRAGNWAVYGAEMERLGELLRRMGGRP